MVARTPTSRPSIRRLAPAKLNLALAVARAPEPGGYHPIASWMHPIDLCDELLVTRLEDDRLSRYAILWHDEAPRKSPIDWSITKDLAVRAHLLLEQEAGRALPVQLKLDKRIPVGGGLGGGSSDAAAMLLAVRELFALDIPDARLARLAHTLGSDVPFFLAPGPAIVEGLGERVERTASRAADVLLIMPPFGCPTAAVYRAFDELAPPQHVLRTEEVRDRAHAPGIEAHTLFNDLAAAAECVAPALAELRARASEALGGAPVHVTGSGSTLFALRPEGDAERSADLLRRALGDAAAVLASRLDSPE